MINLSKLTVNVTDNATVKVVFKSNGEIVKAVKSGIIKIDNSDVKYSIAYTGLYGLPFLYLNGECTLQITKTALEDIKPIDPELFNVCKPYID